MNKASVAYDANAARILARRMLQRANSMVIVYTLSGFLLGLVCTSKILELDSMGEQLAGGAVLGFLFGRVGMWRALALELQAHLLLSQVRIERNTMNTYRWLTDQDQLVTLQPHTSDMPASRTTSRPPTHPRARMPTADSLHPPG